MEEEQIADSTDRISALPDSIIHLIMTYLPRKDLTRTTVLSKNWINIDACLSLRVLLFQGTTIIDSWVNDLVPRLPFLEKLELDGCCTLQRIKISSGTLKRLILHCCKERVEVEIDAPSLLWFSYGGKPILSSLINVSSGCKANLCFTNYYQRIDTLWFVELRKSVSLANDQFRHFQVAVVLEGDAAFVAEELPITGLPKECEVEHLELRILPADVYQKAILSGLLWSCHPATIYMESQETFQGYFTRGGVLRRLVYMADIGYVCVEKYGGI